MPRLPRRRVGTRLQFEQEDLPFSPWPLARHARGTEPQRILLTPNPWEVALTAATLRVSPARLPEVEAFINQAEELYRAATAGTRVNPMLVHLAFDNLARALIIGKGHARPLVDAGEGIAEQRAGSGWEMRSASLQIEDSAEPKVVQLLAQALGLPVLAPGSEIPILDLLPQVVVGHRLYRSGTGAPEQFAPIHELQFMVDAMEKTVWIDLTFDTGRLGRADMTSAKLIAAGGLGSQFREVESDLPGRRRFEMLEPFSYEADPWERLQEAVEAVKPLLWTALGKAPPYRVHHLCLAASNRIPQVLSLYLIIHAFGSVIHQWPHRFDQLLSEPIGNFVVDFMMRQPEQLLFLLTCEFAEREVFPGAALPRPARNADRLTEFCPV
jgi:hypothetical protein